MIIADTSAWVEHFRRLDDRLAKALNEGQVALHPFVYGELLLGGLPAGPIRSSLIKLRPAPQASNAEVAALIEWADLRGTGVGYVDVHLLAAAHITPGGILYTGDKKLHAQAQRLGVATDIT